MSKGGFRPGAGRPPGPPKAALKVVLRIPIAKKLRATIPEKERSAWIEELIVEGLKTKAPGQGYLNQKPGASSL